jgi:ABC-type phosphate transport system substrate-binding protein
MAYWIQDVLKGEMGTAPAYRASSDSEVVAIVAAHPNAIGFVRAGTDSARTRELRVSNLTGLAYRSPDPELVYRGEYPLTRQFSFYTRTSAPPLANGMITFATSMDGQRLVHEGGLVPTSVPVRFVRSSPMLGSH